MYGDKFSVGDILPGPGRGRAGSQAKPSASSRIVTAWNPGIAFYSQVIEKVFPRGLPPTHWKARVILLTRFCRREWFQLPSCPWTSSSFMITQEFCFGGEFFLHTPSFQLCLSGTASVVAVICPRVWPLGTPSSFLFPVVDLSRVCIGFFGLMIIIAAYQKVFNHIWAVKFGGSIVTLVISAALHPTIITVKRMRHLQILNPPAYARKPLAWCLRCGRYSMVMIPFLISPTLESLRAFAWASGRAIGRHSMRVTTSLRK